MPVIACDLATQAYDRVWYLSNTDVYMNRRLHYYVPYE